MGQRKADGMVSNSLKFNGLPHSLQTSYQDQIAQDPDQDWHFKATAVAVKPKMANDQYSIEVLFLSS